jgi:hypothetical protein
MPAVTRAGREAVRITLTNYRSCMPLLHRTVRQVTQQEVLAQGATVLPLQLHEELRSLRRVRLGQI